MLVYVAHANSNNMQITATLDTTYSDTIYAPNSLVTLEGTGDTMGVNAQVIGEFVKTAGNAFLDISYDESKNYYLPPAIDLTK